MFNPALLLIPLLSVVPGYCYYKPKTYPSSKYQPVKLSNCAGLTLTKVGCYYERKPKYTNLPLAFSQLMLTADNNANEYVGYKRYDFVKYQAFLDRFICDCVRKVQAKGFPYFSLQNYFECWSGKDAGTTFNKYGKAAGCMRGDKRQCDVHSHDICVGSGRRHFVYTWESTSPTHGSLTNSRTSSPRVPSNSPYTLSSTSSRLLSKSQLTPKSPSKSPFTLPSTSPSSTPSVPGTTLSANKTASILLINCDGHGTEIKLKKVGCWMDGDDKTDFPELMLTATNHYNHRAFAGYYVDTLPYEQFLHRFICDCSHKVHYKGYSGFGLQSYGECWSGKTAGCSYDTYGQSSGCINQKKQKCLDDSPRLCSSTTARDAYVYVFADLLNTTCPKAISTSTSTNSKSPGTTTTARPVRSSKAYGRHTSTPSGITTAPRMNPGTTTRKPYYGKDTTTSRTTTTRRPGRTSKAYGRATSTYSTTTVPRRTFGTTTRKPYYGKDTITSRTTTTRRPGRTSKAYGRVTRLSTYNTTTVPTYSRDTTKPTGSTTRQAYYSKDDTTSGATAVRTTSPGITTRKTYGRYTTTLPRTTITNYGKTTITYSSTTPPQPTKPKTVPQGPPTVKCYGHEYKLTKLGCWNELGDRRPPRALPELLLTARDRNSRVYAGYDLDRNDYPVFLDKFVCDCVYRVKEKGHSVFGVQFYGECWSGPKAGCTYNKFRKTKGCVNGKMEPCSDDTSKLCTGDHHRHIYVYVPAHTPDDDICPASIHTTPKRPKTTPLSYITTEATTEVTTSPSRTPLPLVTTDVTTGPKSKPSPLTTTKATKVPTTTTLPLITTVVPTGPPVVNCYGYQYKLKKLGCYKERYSDPRAIPELLLTSRDKSSSHYVGYELDKYNYPAFLERFVCDCVSKMKKKGYSLFGLKLHGECWSGRKAGCTYNMFGKDKDCVNKEFKNCSDSSSKLCSGERDRHVYVYVPAYIPDDQICPTETPTDGVRPITTRLPPSTKKPTTAATTGLTTKPLPPITTEATMAPTGPPIVNCYGYQYKLKKLGCYRERYSDPRAIPELLLTSRDKSSSHYVGYDLDKYNYPAFLERFVCDCVSKMKKKGYSLFGLKLHGECWSGRKAGCTYNMFGKDKDCVNEEFRKCTDSSSKLCSGGRDKHVYVYVPAYIPDDQICPTETPTDAVRPITTRLPPSTTKPKTVVTTRPSTRSLPPITTVTTTIPTGPPTVRCYGHEYQLKKLGCFQGREITTTTFSELVLTAKDKTSKVFVGYEFHRQEYKTFLQRFLCDCVYKVKEKGYSVFGVQFYGECRSGPKVGCTYAKHRKSNGCVDENLLQCSDDSSTLCSGHSKQEIYVYVPVGIPDSVICPTDPPTTSLPPITTVATIIPTGPPTIRCYGHKYQLRKLGCFQEHGISSQTFSELVLTAKDKTSKVFVGYQFHKHEYKIFLQRFVCDCVYKVNKKGYSVFGVQFYGECWSGPKVGCTYNQLKRSNGCVNENLLQCSDDSSVLCSGHSKREIYIYVPVGIPDNVICPTETPTESSISTMKATRTTITDVITATTPITEPTPTTAGTPTRTTTTTTTRTSTTTPTVTAITGVTTTPETITTLIATTATTITKLTTATSTIPTTTTMATISTTTETSLTKTEATTTPIITITTPIVTPPSTTTRITTSSTTTITTSTATRIPMTTAAETTATTPVTTTTPMTTTTRTPMVKTTTSPTVTTTTTIPTPAKTTPRTVTTLTETKTTPARTTTSPTSPTTQTTTSLTVTTSTATTPVITIKTSQTSPSTTVTSRTSSTTIIITQPSTSSPTTKPSPTIPPGFKCSKTLDIVIAVDASGSIMDGPFENIKSFVGLLTRRFTSSTNFGVISYNHEVNILATLEERLNNSAKLRSRIGDLRFLGEATLTQKALRTAKELFEKGARRNVEQVLLLFTDGRTYGGKGTLREPLKELRDSGVRVTAVAVGPQDYLDIYSLEVIAGKQDLTLISTLQDTRVLGTELDRVAFTVCAK